MKDLFLKSKPMKITIGKVKKRLGKKLKKYEEKLNALGIVPQNRLKRSLWEMFKKGDK